MYFGTNLRMVSTNGSEIRMRTDESDSDKLRILERNSN